MLSVIHDNIKMMYRVIDNDGNVLMESTYDLKAAQVFLESTGRADAFIQPVTASGDSVLLG